MKKVVITTAVLVSVAFATGCSTIGAKAPSSAGLTAAADGSGTKVAFVSQVEGIPYFAGFKKGAEEQAQKLGLSYTQAGPSTADSAEQLRIFNSLVQQGFKAIAISPLDPTSMNSAISQARAKGIVVITADADAPSSERQAFVQQATDTALGTAAMDQIGEAAGGQGTYGIVSGAPDTDTFNRWIAAIQAENTKKYPNMKLVGGIRYTTTTAQALTETQNLMTANPELRGLIAIPSTAVPGVAQAVKNANKSGKIAVTGFGSPQTAAPFIKSGAMNSTVLWDVPKLGGLTVLAMNVLLTGKTLNGGATIDGYPDATYDDASKTLVLGPPTVFTKENVDQFDY